MRSTPLRVLAVSLIALTAACTSSEGGGTGEASSDEEPTTPVATASEEPVAYTAPVLPEFEVPEGFAQIDGEIPFKLEYESLGTAYQLGETPSDVIYVTSYLLPEGQAPGSYEQMVPIVDAYNAVSANEIEDSVTTPALVHGMDSIFRYAEVRDSLDAQAYQRNFFAFDGRLMIHLSCQWQTNAAAVKSACHQISSQLSIPAPEAD